MLSLWAESPDTSTMAFTSEISPAGWESTVNVDVVDIFGSFMLASSRGVAHRRIAPRPSGCVAGEGGEHRRSCRRRQPQHRSLGSTAGRACSSSSSTSTTEPSPITNPSRLFEKGREAVLGESLRVEGVHRVETATCGVDGASAPPVMMASAAQTDKVERVDD